MADTGGRISATRVISPIQRSDRGTRSLHKDVGHLSRELTLSIGQGLRERARDEQKGAQPTTVAVFEQWICLVLGLLCIAFGMWGICMEPEQDAVSTYIAWLGSLYIPTLRVTAVVCIGLGVMLARRGWAHL